MADAFDEHDIDLVTGFANTLAEVAATSERADRLRKTIARMEELIEEKETHSQELKHRVCHRILDITRNPGHTETVADVLNLDLVVEYPVFSAPTSTERVFASSIAASSFSASI